MYSISETVNRKFVDVIDLGDWEIMTPSGWQPVARIMKTVKYRRWSLRLENGYTLDGADKHIVVTNRGEVFLEDLRPGDYVYTDAGLSRVSSCIDSGIDEHMYDIEVADDDHLFYSNGIVSHNTTVAAGYLLHQLIFNKQFTVAILANKGEQSIEVLGRVKAMFEEIPLWMQPGVRKWNEKSIFLGHKSRAFCATTSPSSIRGKSINILYIDEFAHIENDVEFYQATYPVIMSGKTTKVIITSTPNGMNLFYKIWTEAMDGRNDYKALQVFWHEHPDRDASWLETQERNMPPKQIAQEVHCAFLGSSDTLISGAKLQRMTHIAPIREENEGAFLVYADPREVGSYVAVVDTAEGVGLDYSVCTIVDVSEQPYKVAAKYRSNMVPPLLFAKSVYQIATRYGEAVCVVESNNSSGAIVCDELWNTYEYENMITTKAKDGENKVHGGQRSIPGVRTTVRTKAIGCSSLKSLIESDLLVVEDFDIIHELSTFCLDTAGKTYKASKGKFDDTVMSLVIFGWFANEPYFAEMVDLNVRQILRERLEASSDFDMLTVYFTDGLEEFEGVVEVLPI